MAFNGKSGDGPHSKRICIGINSENMDMVSGVTNYKRI
jgi:hypothetical protein